MAIMTYVTKSLFLVCLHKPDFGARRPRIQSLAVLNCQNIGCKLLPKEEEKNLKLVHLRISKQDRALTVNRATELCSVLPETFLLLQGDLTSS